MSLILTIIPVDLGTSASVKVNGLDCHLCISAALWVFTVEKCLSFCSGVAADVLLKPYKAFSGELSW